MLFSWKQTFKKEASRSLVSFCELNAYFCAEKEPQPHCSGQCDGVRVQGEEIKAEIQWACPRSQSWHVVGQALRPAGFEPAPVALCASWGTNCFRRWCDRTDMWLLACDSGLGLISASSSFWPRAGCNFSRPWFLYLLAQTLNLFCESRCGEGKGIMLMTHH